MFKNLRLSFGLTLLAFGIFFIGFSSEAALTFSDSYKAIVKINTYYEDEDHQLTLAQSGSGVIIDPSGIILTNYHVVNVEDGFDAELPVSFIICLTADPTIEPLCIYSADLITKDEDKDIALLKIRNTPLSTRSMFDSLLINSSENFKENDVVQAVGYPEVGGDTITVAIGTISGTVEKYGSKWIKNSALTSFGSSGGALVDTNGYLLGITSKKVSDLGYAINMSSINKWIDDNKKKAGQISSLQTRTNEFIVKKDSLKKTITFSNSLPDINVTIPNNWEYKLTNEDYLYIDNKDNQLGGSMAIEWDKWDTLVKPMMDVTVKHYALTGNYFSAGNINIGGKEGKKLITHSNSGEEISVAKIPSKNYMITISWHNGKEGVDKEAVSSIFNKIKITDANNNYTPQYSYEHNYPHFKISISNNWSMMSLNNHSVPVTGQKPSEPEVGWSMSIDKLTDAMKGMNNDDFLNYIKDNEAVKSNIEHQFSFKATRYYTSTHYKINNELTNVIHYRYEFKDEEDNDKIKLYAAGYQILLNDRVLIIEFSSLNDNKAYFEKQLKTFEGEVLKNLTLQSSGKTVKDSSTQQTKTQAQTPQNAQEKIIKNIGKKLIGKILLRVEANGEAWYVCPGTDKAYFLGRPADAFKIMRELGLGISEPTYSSFKGYAPKSLAGKILLRVEAKGEAYYVDPKDNKLYFLGRPEDAFQVMRRQGLGITNANFDNL